MNAVLEGMSLKMDVRLFLLGYLLAINFLSIGVTIHDKRRARNGGWRTPESTLLFLSAIGGSVGMYLTMKKIRHKTQKKKFMIGIPVIFVFQIVVLVIGIYYASSFIG